MASAPEARWHGDNYQSRIFWLNAFNLLNPTSGLAEVTFEADGPKSFDDVVVRYATPLPGADQHRVSADYHQVKWHVDGSGRLGFQDLTLPAYIGATRFSLLERLRDAHGKVPPGGRFSFLTTDRIADGDPLDRLVSKIDSSLLVEKLFDGTGDTSRMGAVRKAWREHLGLASDDELRPLVSGLRVFSAYRTLEELRRELEFRASMLGLKVDPSTSDFRYDELARRLKARKLNRFTPEIFRQLCLEEGLRATPAGEADTVLPVAIRTFLGPAADIVGASPDNTLLLTDLFQQRYLRDDRDWQQDIAPRVEGFLRDAVRQSGHLRLILDAHASIAFLAGKVLDSKSSVDVELVQKGRIGTQTWRASDGPDGPRLIQSDEASGAGPDFAVGLSVTQPVEAHMREYVRQSLPSVGKLASLELPSGPGQRVVAGGAHAASLAEQVSNAIRRMRRADASSVVHVFAACPNSLLFYLGQQHQSIAPCVIYEFDFDRQGSKSYQPSFVIR